MSLHIGIDIDDTLYGFVEILRPYLNQFTGQNINFTDIQSFKLSDTWNIHIDDIKDIVRKNDLYRQGTISLEIINKIKELKEKGHRISFVTSRFLYENYNTQQYTKNFLLSHSLDFPLIFTNNKGIICKENKIDLFVDDGLHNLKNIIDFSPTTQVYSIIKPWNGIKEQQRLQLSYEDISKIIKISSLLELD